MIKVVIVDDEILLLNLLKRLLLEIEYIIIVGEFTDAVTALEKVPQLKPDVIFLDVEMPGLNGIELGTKLLEYDSELDIVFVTAFEQYAIQAFKLNAINYILKPANLESIKETVKRIVRKKGNNKKKFTRLSGGSIQLFGDMCLLDAENKRIKWITAKVEELFAILLVNSRQGISKWRIMDNIWSASDPQKSHQNLYTTIFRLKKTLKNAGIEAMIESNSGIYCLNLNNISCDYFEFKDIVNNRAEVNEKNLPEFERAISLYRGDLFGEKAYRWSIVDREACYDEYVEIVKRVAKYYADNNVVTKLKKIYQKAAYILDEEEMVIIRDFVES